MKLEDYKVVFEVVGIVGVLLFASPTLASVLHLPGGEKFSELWLLGPNQMAEDYPFNVKADMTYTIYVGVGNHMGSSTYYEVYAKLRNQTDTLPNATAGTPSSLPQLYEYHTFLQDGKNWTEPLNFSFSGVSIMNNESTVEGLTINGVTVTVDKPSSWDAENKGYYYQLFLELWIYSPDSDAVQFHNRYVSLLLNMTSSSA